MTNNLTDIKRHLEDFRLSTSKLSVKINGLSEIWNDDNCASLQAQIGELAKSSRTLIENGARACANAEKFFAIAEEKVQ